MEIYTRVLLMWKLLYHISAVIRGTKLSAILSKYKKKRWQEDHASGDKAKKGMKIK